MKKISIKLLFSIGIVTIFYSIFLFFQTYSLSDKRIREAIEGQAAMALQFDLKAIVHSYEALLTKDHS